MRRRAVRRSAARAAAAPPARRPPPHPTAPPLPEAAPASGSLVDRLQARARDPNTQTLVLALALVAFIAQGVVAARTNTPTPDEFAYVPAGYYHLRTGDFRLESTNPPLIKMATALPLLAMDLQLDRDPRWRDNRTGWGAWIFGTRFMELNRARYLDAFFAARLVVLAIGVGLAVLLFTRASALLSPVAALATLVLYATMPPVVAHSAVATLDIGVTALAFAALVACERFARTKAIAWAAGTGALLGLAFAAKGVAALFVPLVPVLVAVEWGRWDGEGLRRLALGALAAAGGAWVALLAAYGFTGFPLPPTLVEGVRFQMQASSSGEYAAFLDGRWSQNGWWYYYLVTLVLKTPLPSLALLGVGLVAVARRRDRRDLWLVVPPLFLLYVLSFHYGKNYGVRYLLPAFPFFLLLAGRGVEVLLARGAAGVAALGVLLAWQVTNTAFAAPDPLSWFNEIGGGPARARRLLLDSNLDWGQDLGRLKAYMDAHGLKQICLGYFGHVDPHLYGIEYTFPPTAPAPGLCAVSANFLAGYRNYGITYAGPRIVGAGPWTWFDRYTPVARVGRSIWIFDVKPEDVARPPATAP